MTSICSIEITRILQALAIPERQGCLRFAAWHTVSACPAACRSKKAPSQLAPFVPTPAALVWQVDGGQSPLLQRPDTISGTIFRLPAGFRDGDPLPSVRL